MIALAMSLNTSVRLYEVGFLLFAIAGIWMVVAEMGPAKWSKFRFTVAGALITIGAVINIVVAHWSSR